MKYFLVIFVTCGLSSTVLAQCTKPIAKPMFRRSINEFSIAVVSRIALEKENHFITSPLSTWALITSISLGASDLTLTEIKQVLRHPLNNCFNKKYYDFVKDIEAVSEGVTSERTSAVFIEDKMIVKPDFIKKIRSANISAFEIIPAGDSVSAARTINNYVREATHGNINEILTPEDVESVFMVLIDAIYFKGIWTTPFSTAETEISTFYNEKGQAIGDVNLMYVNTELNSSDIDHIKSTVVEIPYGTTKRFSMLVFLPNDNISVTTVLDLLSGVSLQSIISLFRLQTLALQLPRFEINTNLDNMKELLEDMGLRSMFDPSSAQFPHVADFPVFVSNLIQKATVKVTEEGTEASAATEAGFTYRSFPIEFTVNKPFVFMIIDRETQVALFTGAYSKPSVY